jgi:uncharacterized protein (TIRG00374 family)
VKTKRIKLALNIATLAILGLVVYAGREDLKGVIDELRNANLAWLLLFIPLQAVNYHSYARMYQEIFVLLKDKIGYWDMLKVTTELNFVNYVFPSAGLSGFGYFSLRMRSFGVRGSRSTMAQTMRWGVVLASFIPVLVLGVFLLALKDQVSNIVVLAASGLSFGVILLFVVVGFMLERKNGIQNLITFVANRLETSINFFKRKSIKLLTDARSKRLGQNLHRMETDYRMIRGNWRGFGFASRWGILANLTEIATIGVCFKALGAEPVWGAIIVAYGVANIGSFVAILPGGHGVYEALMTTVLISGGVSAPLSLTATLAYRLITTILYVPPGYYFYSKAISEARGMEKLLKTEE